MLLKLNVDLDSDLVYQSIEILNVDIPLIIGAPLNNLLDLVENL